ncbi:MFS transporter [Alcaligenes aquatilis]|uniref:MFS transporter n=1 Tax=Alcaligenes aquatilis TaxID=323284 RepID=A0A3G2HW07_9BURK|nr:MFS transporter [Alcaligenes aquatilis]AYN21300.1 MFS transporter [Alcaligenes aquatilis]
MANSSTRTLDGAGPDGSQDWQVIGVIGIAHASSHFFQLILPTLYIALGQEFGYDFLKLGGLVTTFYLVSCFGQASSGFLVDRIGALPVLKVGLSCFVVAALLIGMANGYGMLLAAALIGGVGNAVFHPVDYSILNHRVSSARLGHAFSAHGLTGNLGWALTPVFITTLTIYFNWRVAVLSAAALIAAVLVLVLINRDALAGRTASGAAPARPQSKESVWTTLSTLLSRPSLWGAFLFFAFATAAMAVVQNYTIPMLHNTYGIDKVVAGTALSGFMLASAAGMFVGGFIASTTPRSEVIVFVSLCVSGALLLVLGAGWIMPSLALFVVGAAGFCSGIASPSRDMLIRRVTPKGSTGAVYGLVYSGMDVGSSLAPVGFGLLLDVGLTQAPWYGAAIGYWTAAGLAVYVASTVSRTTKS